MKDVIGVFSRSGPDQPWKRLMSQGGEKHIHTYQIMYPDHEVKLFKYDGSSNRPFNQWVHDRLKPVR